MEQYYICEELPLALEYGMTLHEFWDEPEYLFFVYQKAYINKAHSQAHLQGLYVNLALNVSLGNMFRNKNDKPLEYPMDCVFNPFNINNNKLNNNKGYINTIDTSVNNSGLYQIKQMIEERRKEQNG